MLLVQAILGIAAFVGIAMLFSSNFRRVNGNLVGFAIALQFVICVLLLKAPGVRDGLNYVNRAMGALGDATVKGTAFAFGRWWRPHSRAACAARWSASSPGSVY